MFARVRLGSKDPVVKTVRLTTSNRTNHVTPATATVSEVKQWKMVDGATQMVVVNVCQGTKENNVKSVRMSGTRTGRCANPATATVSEVKQWQMVDGAVTQMVDVNVTKVTKEKNVMSVRISGTRTGRSANPATATPKEVKITNATKQMVNVHVKSFMKDGNVQHAMVQGGLAELAVLGFIEYLREEICGIFFLQ